MLTIGVTIVYERKYRPITSPDDELALQAFADSIQRRDSLASHRSRHGEIALHLIALVTIITNEMVYSTLVVINLNVLQHLAAKVKNLRV